MGVKTSTSWTKETVPKKKKGALSQKTKLKNAIGVKHWTQLQEYLETKGIEKYVQELNNMKGKDFATAFTSITEFVKPKLARSEVLADIKTDITWHITKTYDSDKKTDESL